MKKPQWEALSPLKNSSQQALLSPRYRAKEIIEALSRNTPEKDMPKFRQSALISRWRLIRLLLLRQLKTVNLITVRPFLSQISYESRSNKLLLTKPARVSVSQGQSYNELKLRGIIRAIGWREMANLKEENSRLSKTSNDIQKEIDGLAKTNKANQESSKHLI